MIGWTGVKCIKLHDAAITHAELTMAASMVSILLQLSVLSSQRLLNPDLIGIPQNYVNKCCFMLD